MDANYANINTDSCDYGVLENKPFLIKFHNDLMLYVENIEALCYYLFDGT